jgi:hypothetical protein
MLARSPGTVGQTSQMYIKTYASSDTSKSIGE